MGCNDTSVRCGKDPRYAPSKSLRFLTQVVQAGFHIESNNGQVTTHRHGIRKMLIAKSSMSCSCFSQATIGNYAHKVFPYGIPARRARTNRVHHGRHAPLGHSVLVRSEVAWDGELAQRLCCWTVTGSAFQGLRTIGSLCPSISIFIMVGISVTYIIYR